MALDECQRCPARHTRSWTCSSGPYAPQTRLPLRGQGRQTRGPEETQGANVWHTMTHSIMQADSIFLERYDARPDVRKILDFTAE